MYIYFRLCTSHCASVCTYVMYSLLTALQSREMSPGRGVRKLARGYIPGEQQSQYSHLEPPNSKARALPSVPPHLLRWHRHTLFCGASGVLCFFTNWKQDPPPAQRLQLTLLRYLLCCGLELNPQYLQGVPNRTLSFG